MARQRRARRRSRRASPLHARVRRPQLKSPTVSSVACPGRHPDVDGRGPSATSPACRRQESSRSLASPLDTTPRAQRAPVKLKYPRSPHVDRTPYRPARSAANHAAYACRSALLVRNAAGSAGPRRKSIRCTRVVASVRESTRRILKPRGILARIGYHRLLTSDPTGRSARFVAVLVEPSSSQNWAN